MNKFAIPTILVATVMVAGIFAFMPVEQASTVHTSGTTTLAQATDITNILTDTAEIGDFPVSVFATIGAATGASISADIQALDTQIFDVNVSQDLTSTALNATPLNAAADDADSVFSGTLRFIAISQGAGNKVIIESSFDGTTFRTIFEGTDNAAFDETLTVTGDVVRFACFSGDTCALGTVTIAGTLLGLPAAT